MTLKVIYKTFLKKGNKIAVFSHFRIIIKVVHKFSKLDPLEGSD